MTKNPVIQVAKDKANSARERTLTSGVRVRIAPISASLIMDVQAQIHYPPVPEIWDEEKQRPYQNPDSPEYKRQVDEVDERRSMAAMDAIVMFGIELADGLPEDDTWLRKLKTLERAGRIDLSGFDLEDEIDLEFLFKRFVAVSTDDFNIINAMVNVSAEGVEQVEESFPGNTE